MQKIIENIIKETWLPLVVTAVEISIIAFILFLVTNFIPHTFLFLHGHGFISWVVLTLVAKLLFFKSKASDDLNDDKEDNDYEDKNRNSDDVNEIMLPFTDTQYVEEEPKRPREVVNVKSGIYPFTNGTEKEGTSTRE